MYAAVACAPLTVANSSASGVTGSTLDTAFIRCDLGFWSEMGENQTATCAASGPGASAWEYVECLKVFEIRMVLNDNNLTRFEAMKPQIEAQFRSVRCLSVELQISHCNSKL